MEPNQKVFLTKNRFQLIGDYRDFAIPVELRKEVLRWSKQAKISIERPLNKDNRYLSEHYFGVDLWRVKNDEQRLWFALRWS